MNHNQLKDLILSLTDGELDPENQRVARRHLESCEECRHEMDDWKKLSGVLFRKIPIQKNPYFTQKVLRAIKEEPLPSRERPLWNWLVPSLGFGVAAVLLFTSFLPPSELVSADDILTTNGVVAESVSVEDFIDYQGEGEV